MQQLEVNTVCVRYLDIRHEVQIQGIETEHKM